VRSWSDEAGLREQLRQLPARPGACYVIAHTHIPRRTGWAGVSVIPRQTAAFARALYAELHRGDEAGASWIVVEAPPETPAWQAIADRLRRAGGA
jgi:L-threonylcarbamoyladenylate synthase